MRGSMPCTTRPSKKRPKSRRRKPASFSTLLKSTSSATKCWKRAAVPMAARSTKSATSGAKRAFCRVPTVRRCLRAAKPRRWLPLRSAPRTTNSASNLLEAGRILQALHAALQLPAVQRRRSGLHARTRPPRNRPRRSRRTRRDRRDSRRSEVPLYAPRGQRHSGIQRFQFDGDRLRRQHRADGCRCADRGPGGRRGDGSGEGRRQVRHPDRHRGRRRSLWRHGFQGRRHEGRHHRPSDGHQGPERHDRADERSARAGAARTAASFWTKWTK